MTKRKKTQVERHDDDIIDLISITNNSSATEVNKYICKECNPEEILMPYPQAQIENPYAGPSFRCPNCNTIYDSSLVKLERAARKVITSSLGSSDDLVFDIISENKGFAPVKGDDDDYDIDTADDNRWKALGGEIIESKIELTDSSGNNRTIVKRDRDYTNRNNV